MRHGRLPPEPVYLLARDTTPIDRIHRVATQGVVVFHNQFKMTVMTAGRRDHLAEFHAHLRLVQHRHRQMRRIGFAGEDEFARQMLAHDLGIGPGRDGNPAQATYTLVMSGAMSPEGGHSAPVLIDKFMDVLRDMPVWGRTAHKVELVSSVPDRDLNRFVYSLKLEWSAAGGGDAK